MEPFRNFFLFFSLNPGCITCTCLFVSQKIQHNPRFTFVFALFNVLTSSKWKESKHLDNRFVAVFISWMRRQMIVFLSSMFFVLFLLSLQEIRIISIFMCVAACLKNCTVPSIYLQKTQSLLPFFLLFSFLCVCLHPIGSSVQLALISIKIFNQYYSLMSDYYGSIWLCIVFKRDIKV